MNNTKAYKSLQTCIQDTGPEVIHKLNHIRARQSRPLHIKLEPPPQGLYYSLVRCAARHPSVPHQTPRFLILLVSSLRVIQNEEQCLREGGVCGLASACPTDSRMAEGLCPNQQASGVECCQTIPTNIKACGGRGGECVEPQTCGKGPREDAQCPGEQVCCIFVN
ncbi:U-scoloptoxin(19)-Sm1a-like [Eriocheir sinensis]|uniref:U-scoloptoxin(19)-Sm1a-like n=1 Tax=Eriocheir sinensis TaxID=95602 RepID=UPI0021CADC2E|nr:U-scoloptoxin(19)-Sm1a-like [Eriocheir sinensis]